MWLMYADTKAPVFTVCCGVLCSAGVGSRRGVPRVRIGSRVIAYCRRWPPSMLFFITISGISAMVIISWGTVQYQEAVFMMTLHFVLGVLVCFCDTTNWQIISYSRLKKRRWTVFLRHICSFSFLADLRQNEYLRLPLRVSEQSDLHSVWALFSLSLSASLSLALYLYLWCQQKYIGLNIYIWNI